MFHKAIGGIIPVRIRNPWRRDKPTRTPRDDSIAAGLFVSLPTLALNTFQDLLARDQQLSTGVPSSTTPQGLSFRNFSDGAQMTLPVVQGAVAAIPAFGAPLAAAIGGLLAVLKAIDTSIQNREALDSLTCQLYTLYFHIADAPVPRTPIEETNRRRLTKVLEDTTNELGKMRGRSSGSARLTQDIAGCSNKINNYLLQFTALSQMQLTELMHILRTRIDLIWRAMMAPAGRLPAVMTLGCVVVVDATGEEHCMLLDQCCSFDRLVAFLPGILSKCRPDKAHIQQWYIERGQYDFVIDNGTNITQLTRESDIWSTIEPGTKIVMRVITTEVSRRFSARYRCHCGKWNEVNGNEATVLEALKDGFTITCSHCERRFQIIVTKEKQILRKQGEKSQSKDHGPAVEEKSLIRNLLRKQVLEEEESEDQQNLVHYASLPPDKKYYECGWVAFDNVCGVLVTGELFLVHLRAAHGIFGNDKTKFRCQWVGCGLQMNKESIGRHVAEVHLLYRYPCIFCGEAFSRKTTLNVHIQKKHLSVWGIPS